MFTVANFFSKDPGRVKKGLNSYNSNRIMSVTVLSDGVFRGIVQASQKKKNYNVEVSFSLSLLAS